MAIKKKEEVQVPQLPERIKKKFVKALKLRQLSDYFGTKFEEVKGEVKGEFETATDFDLTVGKTVGKADGLTEGSIVTYYQSKTTFNVEKMAEMVRNGEVSIEDCLACVSTYRGFNLEQVSKVFLTDEERKGLVDSKEKQAPFTCPIVEVKPSDDDPIFTFRAAAETKQAMEQAAAKLYEESIEPKIDEA